MAPFTVTATTNKDGLYTFSAPIPPSNSTLAVVLANPSMTPIHVFTWTSSNQNSVDSAPGKQVANIPVPSRPPVAQIEAAASVEANIATVGGRGGGRIAVLIAGGKRMANSTIASDKTFQLRSNRLGSGTWLFRVLLMDARGAESQTVSAGSVSIIGAPNVTKVDVAGRTITVAGRGVPFAKVSLLLSLPENGRRRAVTRHEFAAVVGANGDFALSTNPLPEGAYAGQITQEDASGVSDSLELTRLEVAAADSTEQTSSTLSPAEPTGLAETTAVAILGTTGTSSATHDASAFSQTTRLIVGLTPSGQLETTSLSMTQTLALTTSIRTSTSNSMIYSTRPAGTDAVGHFCTILGTSASSDPNPLTAQFYIQAEFQIPDQDKDPGYRHSDHHRLCACGRNGGR
jgi:hypothetical protein